MSDTYNGWTNYATWRVNLELADDYLEMQREDIDAGCIERFDDIAQLADNLKEWVENVITEDDTKEGVTVDYAMAFLSDVNWYEIAEHWTDELIAQEAKFPACSDCGAVLEGDDHELCDQCREHARD